MTQTVLITGANRGIGFALTKGYLEKGCAVIATCRDCERAASLHKLAQTHKTLSILPLDVSDDESIEELVIALQGRPIDVLINNAGILSGTDPNASSLDAGIDQTFGHIDVNGWLRVLHINAIAPIMVTQELMPNLLETQTRKVAMISSKWGSITHMNNEIPFAYGTSKAALNAATKILSSTLQKDGFVVVSLNPGSVRTDMGSQEANLEPEESAARLIRIIDALEPKQTGQFIRHTGEIVEW